MEDYPVNRSFAKSPSPMDSGTLPLIHSNYTLGFDMVIWIRV